MRPAGVISRYIVLGAALGLPVGLLWAWWAPRVLVRSVADADFVDAYPQGFAITDLTLGALLLAAGVVIGVLAARRLARTGFVGGWAHVVGAPWPLRWSAPPPGASSVGGSPVARWRRCPTARSRCPSRSAPTGCCCSASSQRCWWLWAFCGGIRPGPGHPERCRPSLRLRAIRSSGLTSMSRPRRPPEMKIVEWCSAESSTIVGRLLR